MTNDKFNSILNSVNREINNLISEFENNGCSETYNRIYSRIIGMVEVFRIATDEKFYLDNNGLHYENGEIVKPLTPELNGKQVLKIDGYTLEPAEKGRHSIQVMTNDNCVVDFENLNCAEFPVLLNAFESDESVVKFVVADSKGAYIYGENDLIREGDAPNTTED